MPHHLCLRGLVLRAGIVTRISLHEDLALVRGPRPQEDRNRTRVEMGLPSDKGGKEIERKNPRVCEGLIASWGGDLFTPTHALAASASCASCRERSSVKSRGQCTSSWSSVKQIAESSRNQLILTVLCARVAGVAQLVRAAGCGPAGRGFETHRSPHSTRLLLRKSLAHGLRPSFHSGLRPLFELAEGGEEPDRSGGDKPKEYNADGAPVGNRTRISLLEPGYSYPLNYGGMALPPSSLTATESGYAPVKGTQCGHESIIHLDNPYPG